MSAEHLHEPKIFPEQFNYGQLSAIGREALLQVIDGQMYQRVPLNGAEMYGADDFSSMRLLGISLFTVESTQSLTPNVRVVSFAPPRSTRILTIEKARAAVQPYAADHLDFFDCISMLDRITSSDAKALGAVTVQEGPESDVHALSFHVPYASLGFRRFDYPADEDEAISLCAGIFKGFCDVRLRRYMEEQLAAMRR